MNKKGTLIVLIGPSGSGKGTVLKEVLKNDDSTFLSISATTRKMRAGEVDGVNYYYITREEFESRIEQNKMLEYAVYCDNYYGTPKDEVVSRLDKGENIILEIEVQGAKKVKQMFPEALQIFITPPSFEELRNRLVNRNTEDMETINKRLTQAKNEIGYAKECDYIVVNDEVSAAADDIIAIIRSAKCKKDRMFDFIENMQKNI